MPKERMMVSALLALAVLCSCVSCQSEEQDCYCVKSQNELNCTLCGSCQSECHPLSYYLNKSSTMMVLNDTTFYFLPGVHMLQEVFNFTSRNTTIYNLRLIGIAYNGSQHCVQARPVAIVQCKGNQSGLFFQRIHNLTITGISFNGCGFIDNRGYTASALLIKYVRNMHVCGVEINRTRGWGLFCYLVLGESFINYTNISEGHYTATHSGGNLRLKYYYHEVSNCTERQYIHVSNSVIMNGIADSQNPSAYAGGIDIYLTTTHRVDIILYSVTMVNNSGFDGGNIAITYSTLQNGWTSTVNIINCDISDGYAHTGAGLYIELILKLGTQKNASSAVALNVENTRFFSNRVYGVGGGVYVQLHENKHLSGRANITFSECIFNNNSGHSGSAAHIINFHLPGYISHHLPEYSVCFDTCIFEENAVEGSYASIGCGTLYVEDNALTVIRNSTFSNNTCSGIAAIKSSLVLEGHILISNNTAHNGGGILLCAGAVMHLSPNVHVLIERNSAYNFGGGIYAELECSEAFPPCFYQVNDTGSIPAESHAVHLVENHAAQAGHAVYGGAIDMCYIFEYESKDNPLKNSELFEYLFEIHPRNHTSTISSNPYKICFCNPEGKFMQTECKQTLHPHPIHAGDTVSVSAVVVGQMNGTAPGVVVAKLEGVKLELGHLQNSQIINSSSECTTLKYTITNISDANYDANISLSVENADFRGAEYYTLSSIEISIHPCPNGFELTNGRCDCLKTLSMMLDNVSCDITSMTITREGSVSWWLGCDDLDNNLIFGLFCPFDFCTTKKTDIIINSTTENYDIQCAFARSGILCGECKHGLSIVFGSAKCKPCHNSAIIIILLTLLFALLGIFLVLLLGFLNLNVTEGTLNAIIFYMNIMRINFTLFFHSHKRPTETQHHVVSFLKVFVAWMNLDLGIETCYFNGMDAIGKVALQFVFPLYLWILTALIIYFSRRYSLIARMAGKSSVKLLATIILFSYAKIVRCIIDVCWPSKIYHVANTTESLVWHLDGNIAYFHRKHGILLCFAILMACCTLPYTLTLLFIQCLRKWSHMKPLFWVVRLKPFLDAYTGPYRDRYHFWTGFLLIVRICLFLAIAANTTKGPILNIVLITMTAAILLLFNLPGIYKTWKLTAIEAFTHFNLIIFSSGTAYVKIYKYSNFYVVFPCVGSMFLLFCGVVVNNVYKKISDTNRWGAMKVWLLEKEWPWMKRKSIRSLILPPAMIDSSSSEDELDPILQNAPPVAKYDHYREPLIETTAHS